MACDLRATTAQRFDQIADDAMRSARILQVASDVRMRKIESAVAREAVALLGDGDRHEHASSAQPSRCSTVSGLSGATSTSLIAPITWYDIDLVANRERVEVVLRRKRIAHIRAAQGNRADAPARIARSSDSKNHA